MRPYRRLAECTEFEWDEGNSVKNWEKHAVSQSECEQIFLNKPLIVKRDKKHSMAEARYFALGKTDTDRFLFSVFTIRGKKIRIISARNMTEDERRRYPP